ncbi:radical SAM family heme chaperone HemW [Kocuria sp. p3-SID1433]|uniref:radical SAM family heme chaperone HemW n=1 Tax=unclassified Kocuria TaxID=2649579 RepID=UPI0021A438C6|nr:MULTISPECIES: radical SAM family heme chaperone HemW [unclassified Kocuria]MCT1600723.1 radical SAM family heme chaperone HemW [Kocuria sp. p3-SID1428]MCT2178958.1 radical SAM family heme chaperone HemW [Kocuria sp. p3-SID1433]
MPSLPDGETPPEDGLLPDSAARGSAERTLSLYVHVPFCSVRCGYCDFNTYTALELGPDVSQAAYHLEAVREIEFARHALETSGVAPRQLHTVFFGGGTPTRLASTALVEILRSARESFGLVEDAEVTTEANPDSVTREDLQTLADGGFTRVSFGVQSAVPHVLRTLERTHDPANVPRVVQWAQEAGLSVSTDLIYGTPGESLEDWRESLRQAISLKPDHLSAYSLIVEDGTRMAAQMRRGEVAAVDPDDQAEKYAIAEQMLAEAGFEWYEISNWSRAAGGRSAVENRSAHNLAYWHNQDWWGVGPGAHSHVGGVRWWNRKHPMPYAQTVRRGLSPAVGRELLDDETRYVERVMLESRIADGMPIDALRPQGRAQIAGLVAEELIDGRSAVQGRLVLTLRGRLLGDAVVRRLLVD